MRAETFNRLVENIRRDGKLTQLPAVARAGEWPLTEGSAPDDLEVLSGNHRVQAAIAAGLEEIEWIEILTPMTRSERVALQLSHNAIAGEDDRNKLELLYAGLELGEKLYSGLTDDDFKDLGEVDTTGISVGAPSYEHLEFWFLPEDAEAWRGFLERLKDAKPHDVHVARFEDFEQVFDTLVRVKTEANVHNSAIAMRLMAQLAAERLDQLAEETDAEERGPGGH